MRRFASLIEQLDRTNKTNHKVEALKNYFMNLGVFLMINTMVTSK